MIATQGHYFDGKLAQRQAVELTLEHATLRVRGASVALDLDAQAVRVSPRIANTPRWLYLPDGGACVLTDTRFADRFSRRHRLAGVLHELEARPVYSAFAVAYVVFLMWLFVDRGVPTAVARISEHIPVAAELTLGQETLDSMDRYFMRASTLPSRRQAALKEKFAEMARAGGETADYRVEFRSSRVIGPNAFALPSGIIIMTDELVKLAKNDDEVLSVLAHELGHVRHRHTMRSLLEGSATAIVIAGLTGDIASTTSLAAAAPAVLLHNKFSRAHEREADRYALDLLERTGRDPRYFATILQRMDERAGAGSFPTFLSSHPPTTERKALAMQVAGPFAAELDARPESVDENVEPDGAGGASSLHHCAP